MPKEIDEETKEILISFIAEGYERLDDAEAQLAKIGGGDDTSVLNCVFRLFHSVKGSAGFLGFEEIKKLTHEAETLLDVFLKEKHDVDQESLDVVFATIDVLRTLIGIVEKEYGDETGAEKAREQTAALVAHIAKLRGVGQAPGATPASTPASPTHAQSAIQSATIPVGKAAPSPVANAITLSDLVTADMVARFTGECADACDLIEKTVLVMDSAKPNEEEINAVFRHVHTMKGNSGFFGYAYLESVCMGLEGTLDLARKAKRPVGEALISGIIETVDRIRSALSSLEVTDGAASEKPVAREGPAAPTGAVMRGSIEAQYKPIGEILIDMGVVRDEVLQEALSEQERPIGEILVQKGIVDRENVEKALKIQKEATRGPTSAAESVGDIVRKEIRVDTSKLDKLFELVGELITAESMLINSAGAIATEQDEFMKSFANLNKISREIQETSMMIRMIPLDGLFQKMTRLVRDLSRKTDKPVNFIVSGQDTEMDKNVIEQISDPLVHILRNAIDHGLESREERARRGKAETGTVRMNARYEGSDIWISVRDDGAGIDREAILAKAAEKGILRGDPATMGDKEVFSYIFEPGFSTAKVVSDVSGRGVGLDVVKKNLETIRGTIDIKTVPGEGTEFILAIPLTMAIIDGITVRAGKNRYSIPLSDIIEFFKVGECQIAHGGKNGETINIRSEFLPLIRIHEVFGIKDAVTDVRDGILIVVQNNGKKACLLIDEVIGNQQIVVKSLSGYLGKVGGISGCSILGDGSVSFIIDTGKLISMKIE
jgi:two-component system, chemotaxis family, sensor kinase CheA